MKVNPIIRVDNKLAVFFLQLTKLLLRLMPTRNNLTIARISYCVSLAVLMAILAYGLVTLEPVTMLFGAILGTAKSRKLAGVFAEFRMIEMQVFGNGNNPPFPIPDEHWSEFQVARCLRLLLGATQVILSFGSMPLLEIGVYFEIHACTGYFATSFWYGRKYVRPGLQETG